MTKRIFRTILAVGLAVVLLSGTLFCAALVRHMTVWMFEELENEVRLAAYAVALEGRDYLEGVKSPHRFTWIDGKGRVLFDSNADAGAMENHLEREEVRFALSAGRGRASRRSDTLAAQTLYVALALEDGSILRVAGEQQPAAVLLTGLAPAAALILLLTAALAALLARRLAQGISRPILELDLNHPDSCRTYEELSPLLVRIRSQDETIRDQTDALRQQHEQFTAITENMGEGFLLIDKDGCLLSCNTSALRLLGAEAASPGQSVLLLNGSQAFRQVVDEALAGGRGNALLKEEGACCQLLASGMIHAGRPAGAVVAILDVTERESREILRREFTANVSHELKTPLTSISGFAELMKDGLVPQETVPEFASDIYREAQRLIALVEDVIHLSQLDEDRPMERGSVDLYDLTEDVLERLDSAAGKAGVTLHLAGDHAVVDGVAHILDELVYNLVDNAIKYNRPGGWVKVAITAPGGKARLTVTDTGIGIPLAHQQRVFERFYRVDRSHSKEVGGTGLGLSIAKHAAAYHNAALELESAEGVGTAIAVQWR